VASSLNPVLTAKIHRLQVWKEHHSKVYYKCVCLWQFNVATVSIYNFQISNNFTEYLQCLLHTYQPHSLFAVIFLLRKRAA